MKIHRRIANRTPNETMEADAMRRKSEKPKTKEQNKPPEQKESPPKDFLQIYYRHSLCSSCPLSYYSFYFYCLSTHSSVRKIQHYKNHFVKYQYRSGGKVLELIEISLRDMGLTISAFLQPSGSFKT